MARINIEGIIDDLDVQIKRALEDSVKQVIPEAEFDTRKLFREFKRSLAHRCNTWENVPDRYVER